MTAIPPPPELPGDPAAIRAPSSAYLWRNRHWTVPAAMLPATAIAGEVAKLTGAHFAGVHSGVIAGAGVGSVAMWLAAPHKWDRWPERVYAGASVTLAGTWLSVATWTGDSTPMLIAGSAVTVMWGICWFAHKRPRRKKAEVLAVAQWNDWWQHYAPGWSLSGSKIVAVTSRGVTVTLTVQLWAGRQSHQSITPVVHLIESACRDFIGAGMIRTEPNKANGSQVFLHLKRSDPLAKVITFDPVMLPESASGSITEGVSESGKLIRTPMCVNSFTNGATRTGKSNQLSVRLAAKTAVPDARVWLIDRKGGRAARPWMEAIDWVATTIEEARLMLACAAAEVEARALHAYDGNEQLVPTVEVPAIFVVVDEANAVTSVTRGDSRCAADLAAISSMGSGVCIHDDVVTQYGALDESVRTEQTRSNLPLRLCFRTETSAHGVFALGDKTRADTSRLRGKGSFYWKLGPDAPEEQARGFHMPHDLVREIAKRHGAMPRKPLVLFASQHQAIYDARWQRLPEPLRHLAPQYVPGSSVTDVTEVNTAPPADEAFATAVRIEAEIAHVPDVPLASLPHVPDFAVRDSVTRGRDRFAAALQRAPEAGISPKQLMDASGMSRSWIMSNLAALTSNSAAEKVQDGRYRAVPGRDILAALDEIKAANGRLLEGSAAA
jgi:hypothetical protein